MIEYYFSLPDGDRILVQGLSIPRVGEVVDLGEARTFVVGSVMHALDMKTYIVDTVVGLSLP